METETTHTPRIVPKPSEIVGVNNYLFGQNGYIQFEARARDLNGHILIETQEMLSDHPITRGIEDLNSEGKKRADRRLYDLVLIRISESRGPFEDKSKYA